MVVLLLIAMSPQVETRGRQVGLHCSIVHLTVDILCEDSSCK